MKTCIGCGLTLEATKDNFYWHRQGETWLPRCKPCTREQVKANRRKRLAYYQEYDRVRYDVGGHRGDASKEAKLRSGRAWNQRNKEKKRAHGIVARAIASGRLLRQPCSVCGVSNDVEAHHEDYSKPLDVTWLCTHHHADHRRLPRDPNFQMVRGNHKKAA